MARTIGDITQEIRTDWERPGDAAPLIEKMAGMRTLGDMADAPRRFIASRRLGWRLCGICARCVKGWLLLNKRKSLKYSPHVRGCTI